MCSEESSSSSSRSSVLGSVCFFDEKSPLTTFRSSDSVLCSHHDPLHRVPRPDGPSRWKCHCRTGLYCWCRSCRVSSQLLGPGRCHPVLRLRHRSRLRRILGWDQYPYAIVCSCRLHWPWIVGSPLVVHWLCSSSPSGVSKRPTRRWFEREISTMRERNSWRNPVFVCHFVSMGLSLAEEESKRLDEVNSQLKSIEEEGISPCALFIL